MCLRPARRVSIRCGHCDGSEIENGIACNLSLQFEYSLKEVDTSVDTSDNALMSAVAAGTVSKLAILFERHHRALYRYFISMTRDPQVAEDLVQDVFFRILRYRATYDPRQSFTAWMYQIAKKRERGPDPAKARRGGRDRRAHHGKSRAGKFRPRSGNFCGPRTGYGASPAGDGTAAAGKARDLWCSAGFRE